MRSFEGRAWTQDAAWPANKKPETLGLEVMISKSGRGLSSEPGVLHRGNPGSSGFQAINLAFLLGATRIVLLGYDMTQRNGKHWFGAHPQQVNNHGKCPSRFIPSFAELIDAPVPVLNASRDTAIMTLPRVSLEEALNA